MANSLDRLAARIKRLEQGAMRRGPQLRYSSVEGGALTFNDEDGTTGILIGVQPDGTNAPVVVSGPPPPPLAGVNAAPFIGGLLCAWDGTWAGGVVAPLDFARVEIHVSTEGPDFIPDLVGSGSTTLRGSIGSVRGGKYAVTGLDYAPHWVKFVARSMPGKWGEPVGSATSVTPDKVATIDLNDAAVTTEIIADAAVTANQLAENAVTSAAIAPLAVDSTKIQDFSVLITKLRSTNHMIY